MWSTGVLGSQSIRIPFWNTGVLTQELPDIFYIICLTATQVGHCNKKAAMDTECV